MRKLAPLILVVAVYALIGVGVAAADSGNSKKRQQKPDSIVTCEGFVEGDYGPRNVTVPIPVKRDGCMGVPCAQCIRSLEDQGCKVVDVIVTNWAPAGEVFPVERLNPRATFLLSCAKP